MRSRTKEREKVKDNEHSVFYPWGTVFSPVAIAESWRRFFKFGESIVPEAVTKKNMLRMRAATLSYVDDMKRGTPQQRDAVFLGLKNSVDVLLSDKSPVQFYERGRMFWFKLLNEALYRHWDPRCAKVLRGMAKELRRWKGEMRKDALRLAETCEDNAEVIRESEHTASIRNLEDMHDWTGQRLFGP